MQSFVIYVPDKRGDESIPTGLGSSLPGKSIIVQGVEICLLDNDPGNNPVTILENKESGYLYFLQGRVDKVDNLDVLNMDRDSLLLHISSVFREKKNSIYESMEGMFILGICNLQDGSFIIGNDRYGTIPFYYLRSDFAMVFSNHAGLLARTLGINDLDHNAVASFFTMGFVLNERTLFKGIHLFDPGSFYDTRVKNHLHRYWDFEIREQEKFSREDYIDKSIYLIKKSVINAVHPDEKFYVSLSGGLDSRWIAAVLAEKYERVNTVTYGIRNTHDPSFAEAVAKRIGSVHHYIPYDPGFIPEFAELAVELTDGMTSLQNFHDFLPSLYLRDSELNVKLSGYYIDLLFGVHMLGDHIGEQDQTEITSRETLLAYLRKKYFSGFSEADLDVLFFGFNGKYNLTEELSRSVMVRHHEKDRYNAEYFDYQQLLRRGRLPFQLWQANYGQFRLPFINYELVDFCLQLPYHEKRDLKLYRDAFQKAYPDLSEIFSQRYNSRLDASPLVKNIKLYWFYAQYAGKRSLEIATRGNYSFILRRLWSNYDQWLRKEINPWMRENIEYLRNIDFLNFDYIKRLARQHENGRKNNAVKIYLLITFSIWYRKFFD